MSSELSNKFVVVIKLKDNDIAATRHYTPESGNAEEAIQTVIGGIRRSDVITNVWCFDLSKENEWPGWQELAQKS